MKKCFVPKRFTAAHMAVIDQANEIIEDYKRQGFLLTLRQLYYQFVRRVLIENKQSEYKRLGSIINDARLAGLIDWDAIEDRTRNLETQPAWDDPASLADACAQQYREDLWRSQPCLVEVWIEKEALVGVIEPICKEFRLPYFACRGYVSQSEQYAAGQRFRRTALGISARARGAGRRPVVLHLGDHDPSGLDMTRDIEARLAMFAGRDVDVRRLALNYAQVEELDLPPNPAKETDSRASGYMAEHGDGSWELDALEPAMIADLIREAVGDLIVPALWADALAQEERQRGIWAAVARDWDRVEEMFGDEGEDEE